MDNYYLEEITPKNLKTLESLLEKEGIEKDKNLDFSLGLYDMEGQLLATGSSFGNTLRCLAVDKNHQGEGLLNKIMNGLIQYQIEHGNTHLFLYTKCDTAHFFTDLGFHEIARVPEKIVFMENLKDGFSDYIDSLGMDNMNDSTALVMNCNPFTLGHQYLIEQASYENKIVHLFIVSEEKSFFPFEDRFHLVKEGCKHLKNIYFHETKSYMISNSVFPSYFLKEEASIIETHAKLDLEIFCKIASVLKIKKRYVGEEPFSLVTGIYNKTMVEKLPENGIEVIVIPRKKSNGKAISASFVRELLKNGDMESVKKIVPSSTYDYFLTKKGQEVIEKLKTVNNVSHY